MVGIPVRAEQVSELLRSLNQPKVARMDVEERREED